LPEKPCKPIGESRKEVIDDEFFADIKARGSELFYRTKDRIHDWSNLKNFEIRALSPEEF